MIPWILTCFLILSLLRRKNHIAWCCPHHISLLGWYFKGEMLCKISPVIVLRGLRQALNITWTTTFFLQLFQQGLVALSLQVALNYRHACACVCVKAPAPFLSTFSFHAGKTDLLQNKTMEVTVAHGKVVKAQFYYFTYTESFNVLGVQLVEKSIWSAKVCLKISSVLLKWDQPPQLQFQVSQQKFPLLWHPLFLWFLSLPGLLPTLSFSWSASFSCGPLTNCWALWR